MHKRSLAVARWVATAALAGIAAWVSYWHMAGVAARYGETGGAQYLLPLPVDGLVVVASVCLVELAGRIREVEQPETGWMAYCERSPVRDCYIRCYIPILTRVAQGPAPSVSAGHRAFWIARPKGFEPLTF
ncbi:MAG TPA: DUF2637 domain-containing protein [Micromonosporaceae bacterium]|nr:DUF2637 domain-containing protein [Micromonosporaceae bacterium]